MDIGFVMTGDVEIPYREESLEININHDDRISMFYHDGDYLIQIIDDVFKVMEPKVVRHCLNEGFILIQLGEQLYRFSAPKYNLGDRELVTIVCGSFNSLRNFVASKNGKQINLHQYKIIDADGHPRVIESIQENDKWYAVYVD